ncbi:hypothetical protein AUC60_01565 [Pseudomonas caspiana]|uniref:Uncharacterized protein n=1 Tax=Pseudomonas caspiana TaxID=1451454 RepID=A0A1Y3PB76_9PSED|nr:hypothetical protein AUC60_01565 [Pseudomonas caspiana]
MDFLFGVKTGAIQQILIVLSIKSFFQRLDIFNHLIGEYGMLIFIQRVSARWRIRYLTDD